LSSEIQQRVRSRLVIPIAVLAGKTDVSFALSFTSDNF
jgi:hypothetical protein